MTTQEIASKLVQMIKENKYEEIYQTLYHDDIITIENPAFPNEMMRHSESHGMPAKLKSGADFQASIAEVHSEYTGDPVVAGNTFAVAMGMDITTKDGVRYQMDEIAVYTVKDGKIAREEFIY